MTIGIFLQQMTCNKNKKEREPLDYNMRCRGETEKAEKAGHS